MSENMIFCLGVDKYESSGAGYQKNYQVFNTQLEKTEWENVRNSLPNIELPLTKWVEEKNMTAQEKKDKAIYKEIGGYLKVLDYEEAWQAWWKVASQEDKNKILNCKYFDGAIFTGITGIKDFATMPTLKGKEVEVKLDGKVYKAIIQ